LNSDNSPILLTLSENIIQKENNPVLIDRRTDWENFRILGRKNQLDGTIKE
jgi:hypothetical protein